MSSKIFPVLSLANNADIHLYEDVMSVIALIIVIAISHWLLERLVFQNLALQMVPRPIVKDTAKLSPPPSPTLGPEGDKQCSPNVNYRKQMPCGSKITGETNVLKTYNMNIWKFRTAIYKFICYSLLMSIGWYALISDNKIAAGPEGNWISDGWASGGLKKAFDDWPRPVLRFGEKILNFDHTDTDTTNVVTTSPILFHYQFALAFYIYSSILLAFDLEGPKQKDKYQMLTHHFITSFLIVFSWYFQLARAGAWILVLHDISDPLMELAKMSLYSGQKNFANFWFSCFALSFLFTRCIVFPLTVLYPCFSYLASPEGYAKAQLLPGWWLPLIGLCGLQLLHFFWGSLIVKMVVDTLVNGDVGDDIRDEE